MFLGLFSIWLNVELSLANFWSKWQVFIVVNGQILKNKLVIWSHCVAVQSIHRDLYFAYAEIVFVLFLLTQD